MIYLDNNATTQVDKEILEEILPYFSEKYGNPSSKHQIGRESKKAIGIARSRISELINAGDSTIIFTGSGTEANNMAILGCVAKLASDYKGHIITTSIEHSSVLNVFNELEKRGLDVTYLPVDEYGVVNSADLESSIREDTFLVSIMYANNEIGTLQNIKELARIAHSKDVLFHTDAIQALGKVPVDVKDLEVDLMTISSHKLYGPKAVGALYLKRGLTIPPVIFGGGQEGNMRSGTENVPGIVGFGKACEILQEKLEENIAHMKKLKSRFRDKVALSLTGVSRNGHPVDSLPNTLNLSFPGIESEALSTRLDEKGVAVGGTDSTLLAKIASEVIDRDKLVLAHAILPFSPKRETAFIKEWTKKEGIPLQTMQLDLLKYEDVKRNDSRRCYYCKHKIMGSLIEKMNEQGIQTIADGTLTDDYGDYRPGLEATAELGIQHPLADAGFDKRMTRLLARKMEISNWNTPASACLASRIPCDTPMEMKTLRLVGEAEDFMYDAGFAGSRVRALTNNTACVEVNPIHLSRLFRNRQKVSDNLKKIGFKKVTMDMNGYKQGAMNK